MYAWHCCLKCGGVGGSVPRVNIEEAPRQGHQNALAQRPAYKGPAAVQSFEEEHLRRLDTTLPSTWSSKEESA